MDSFESFVQVIIHNAESPASPNGISKELTYQQAMSIAIRSDQLANESSSHPTKKNFDRQIDECYRRRDEELRNG